MAALMRQAGASQANNQGHSLATSGAGPDDKTLSDALVVTKPANENWFEEETDGW